MISLDIKNLAKLDLKKEARKISEYIKKIKARGQPFYEVIDDKKIVQEINGYVKSVENKFDDIVILGIGGSAVGAKCLKNALAAKKAPRLHILDNIDPVFIKETEEKLNFKRTLFIITTKSGKTIETLAQYYYFRKKCKNFVFITGKPLEKNAKTFKIPENISGRFSILTAVGLLPAKLIGIDIEALLKGAKKMRDKFLSESLEKNLPFQLALIQYLLNCEGKNINVLMPYSEKLSGLADWYCQLLAESTGKNGIGLTPISALGARDQHSGLQLYLDGPDDKLIIFIEIKKYEKDEKIAEFKKTFGELMNIEKMATEKSLSEKKRPNITIKIDKINEETLGELLMLFECSVAFLGEFFGINAFNQPGVERTKTLIKNLL